MSRVRRCEECGDVIGVYEPVVTVDHDGIRLSSPAADGRLADRGGGRYHAACYARVQMRPPADEPRDCGS